MAEVFSFTADGRISLFETLASRERPVTLRVVLHGDARALASELGLRVWQGRVLSVTPANLGTERVLVRLALARAGRVEVRADDGAPVDMASAVPVRRGLVDAEQTARALEALLAPLGGPGVVVVTSSARVVKAAAQLGKAELALANQLLDVPRVVGDVLARSSDDLATARLLDQLRDLGVLEVREGAPPMPLPPRSSGNLSDRPVARSRPPTLRSRPPERSSPVLEIPEAVTDEEDEAPPPEPAPPTIVRTPDAPPVERERPRHREEAPREPDEDTNYAAAGVRSPAASVAPWIAGLAVLVALLALWRWQRDPPPIEPIASAEPSSIPTPPPAPPPPPVATATPSATPTDGAQYSLSRPPPLAGPEADRRLREAERFINSGRYDEAEAILAPLRASQAGDPLVWLLTGQLEIERGRFGKASSAIDKAITIDPKSYRGHILRGSIFQFQGSAKSALKSYRAALAISPGHAMSPELREVADRLEGAED